MKANILNNVGKPPDKLAILCYSGASWKSDCETVIWSL